MLRRVALSALVLASAGTTALTTASPAAAAVPAPCTNATPALNLTVDRDAGRGSRRRAVSFENSDSGGSSSAVKPINLIVVRNGRTRLLTFGDLQGEYRYTARPGERAAFAATYAENGSYYGAVTFDAQPIPQLDLVGIISLVTGLLNQLGIGVVVNGLINLVLPGISVPGQYASSFCTRSQALVVSENATASASRAKVRRANVLRPQH